MKSACPRCGRPAVIDDDLGDFPVRCHYRAALVRKRSSRQLTCAPSQRKRVIQAGRE